MAHFLLIAHSSSLKMNQKLIDTSADERFIENVGLRKWANKENLKIASDTYNRMVAKNIHNFSELNQRILFLQ